MGSVFFSFLIFGFHSFGAFTPEVVDVFAQTNQQSYKPLMCSDTVDQFIKNLHSRGFDLREAQVLMIKHKWAPHFPVLPQKARRRYKDQVYAPFPRWGFHVVLIWQDQVFDFDYTDELQMVPYEEYMAQMWRAEDLAHYHFKLKPALEFGGSDLFGY